MLSTSQLYEVIADIGGRPGVDCKGFCKYCYFKQVREEDAELGCRHCPPNTVGCSKCRGEIFEKHEGFANAFVLQHDVLARLAQAQFDDPQRIHAINISGGGDAGCYPQLLQLSQALGGSAPIHLGYISGKGLTPGDAEALVQNGVRIVTFTVFSTNQELRREWLGDKTPEQSLETLRTFASLCETYAAAVVIPGVNEEDVFTTAADLESWGVQGFILMRFGNYEENGIILGNEPILKNIEPQKVEDFKKLVIDVSRSVKNMRVVGTPLCDPLTGAPFALTDLSDDEFPRFPEIRSEATIITGTVAAPLIKRVLGRIKGSENVNIVTPRKEISDLITHRDLERLSLKEVKDTVVIPGNALVHDRVAKEALSRDGVQRYVVRGPERLTADCESSMKMSPEMVLNIEVEGFTELIQIINAFGLPPKE